MLTDVLKRPIKEGDLVIGMVIGRGSDGIRFGVCNGTSVNWGSGRWGGVASTMSNMYLVENPCAKEAEIRDKIIADIAEAKKKSAEREAAKKLLKRIPTKDLVVGKTYVDDKGNHQIYLGKGIVHESYGNETKEGFIYVTCYSDSYNVEKGLFSSVPYFAVLKSPRKLVALSDKVLTKYPFGNGNKEFILKEEESTWRRNSTITIKLEG